MTCVPAHGDRRCSSMVGVALDRHPLPGNALQVFYRANRDALALQNWPLLDMKLDIGVGLQKSGSFGHRHSRCG